MTTKIEIINLALVRLGANTINNTNEGTAEANFSNVVWDVARRACLRDHPWNFAIREQELAPLTNDEGLAYKYKYQIPANALRLLAVYTNNDYKLYERNIHTDSDKCKIKFVYDVEDTAKWDSTFVDVIGWRIAFELAYALTKSSSTADAMMATYERRLQKARFVDSSEDIEDMMAPNQNTMIDVRF